ncbi:MAG: tetratricopeptide repeat protein [Methylophilaceae bacterium]
MPKFKKIAALLLVTFSATASFNVRAELSSNSSTTPAITTANAEFVYKYLLGEIAGQRGDAALASQLFLVLAKQTRDPRLAERAARSAVYARQAGTALQATNLWVELDPNSLEALQASSQLLVSSGNLSAAKPHIKKLLSREDARANGFLYLGSLFENHKDKNEVFAAVEEFAAPYPKLAEAHFAIAQAAWYADRPGIAKNELVIAEQLRPGWETSAQMHGQILLKESPDKALDFYKNFLRQNPKANDVRMSFARLLVNQKKLMEAKPELIKLADSANGSPEISAAIGLLSLESNEYSMADKYFQQALDAGFREPEQLFIYLGRSAERTKNDSKALGWYDKITSGERYLEGRLSAANVIARTQNVDTAIAMLDEVNHLTSEQQVIVIQTQAGLLSQAKRNQESFNLMEKAINNTANTPELIYDYAMAAERIGKLDLMEAELRKAIQMKPDFAPAYNALGYSFADRNIKLNEAKTLIETALKLSPNDHYMLDSLGWVHYRLGNLTEAVELLRKAYEIQSDPEIAAHLGEVLWKQGLQEEAKKIWANALQTFPENDVLVSTAKKFSS